MFCVTYQITVFWGRGRINQRDLVNFLIVQGLEEGGVLIEGRALIIGIAVFRYLLSLTEISLQKEVPN